MFTDLSDSQSRININIRTVDNGFVVQVVEVDKLTGHLLDTAEFFVNDVDTLLEALQAGLEDF